MISHGILAGLGVISVAITLMDRRLGAFSGAIYFLGACATESLSSAAKVHPQVHAREAPGSRTFRVSRGANPQSTAWFPRVSNEGSRGMIRRNTRTYTLPTLRFLWRRLLVGPAMGVRGWLEGRAVYRLAAEADKEASPG